MFLEQLLESTLDQAVRDILRLIFMQLNFLLCLVNDILDINMISSGNYDATMEKFDPKSVFDFILAMFSQQSQI